MIHPPAELPRDGEATTTTQYRKKPAVVDAVQYEGNGNFANHAVPEWMWAAFGAGRARAADDQVRLEIRTRQGWVAAKPGDWICRQVVNGADDIWPCDAEVFAATYEPARLSPPREGAGTTTQREEWALDRVHELKSHPRAFAHLLAGGNHEVRRHDRDYRVGDMVRFREWKGNPSGVGSFTGRELYRRIVDITPGGAWGMPLLRCVLGLADPATLMGPTRREAALAALDVLEVWLGRYGAVPSSPVWEAAATIRASLAERVVESATPSSESRP